VGARWLLEICWIVNTSPLRPFSLVVVLAALAPSALSGQQSWTFVNGGASTTVRAASSAGYGALPVAALQSLGGEVVPAGQVVRVRIGGAELALRPGSPFFTMDGTLRQLVHPVYEADGVVYVPLQLVVDHLPSLGGRGLAVDVGTRTVRRSGTAASDATSQRAAAPRAAAPAEAAPAARQPARTEPVAEPAARPPATASAGSRPANAQPGRAKRLVVIDAGHGGIDPGAVGPSGTREKDITLAVARRLAAILREDPTLEVRMTRERDTLVALTDRTRLANRWRGDDRDALFMSIHTNAHDQRSVRGFETFFLSDAKTEDARRVAEMENAAQQYESPATRLDPLSFIMHDLRQNKYLRDSSEWAAMIQERLGAVHPGPNRGVKQAGFVVLNGAFMPAVLVELGFITHPAEERLLADAAHQTRLARQLAQAVNDFFERSSPAVTAR
jgi:N-acetylmuramoyl-L-alanine amidase